MTNPRTILSVGLICYSFLGIGQDLHYARNTIELLSSPDLDGRGYVSGGHTRAADFIASEFERFGLQSFNPGYQQKFPMSVNTFPGKVQVTIDKKGLTPGVDFLVDSGSPPVKGSFDVQLIGLDTLLSDLGGWVKTIKTTEAVVAVSKQGYDKLSKEDRQLVDDVIEVLIFNDELKTPAVVVADTVKLTWSVSRRLSKRPVIYVKGHYPEMTRIKLNIDSRMERELVSQNVIGLVEGRRNDSLLVVSAHYDHLGRMGRETYFPGANDNASGIALLLNLARHFSFFEQSEFDILFIAFGGEEAGLVGSFYYTERPLFPLGRTKFVLNLDLVGTGEDGIKVVNGKIYRREFERLRQLNDAGNLLPKIESRGSACNSDHCAFDQHNIPGFFIYTLGGITVYHDIYDRSETLPLTAYENLFTLLKEFIVDLP